MSDLSISIGFLGIVAFTIGILVGLMLSRSVVDRRVREEKENAVASAEKEMKTLSQNLNKQMQEVRDGIIQSALSYQQLVDTMKASLPSALSSELDVALKGSSKLIELQATPDATSEAKAGEKA